MIGIRQKLMLGFGGLLVIILLSGVFTLFNVGRLGGAVDTILKENYRSVTASQQMKESLERIDSGLLFILTGNAEEGHRLINENIDKFRDALRIEESNITLPGEKAAADRIAVLFSEYSSSLGSMTENTVSPDTKREMYHKKLYPLFYEIKSNAQKILDMNQAHMVQAGRTASELSETVFNRTIAAIAASFIIAALFSMLTHKWILRPIRRLIESTGHIKEGNLNLVLEVGSKDEIGQLSESFNEMAHALRAVKKLDMAKVATAERSADDMLKVLPEAIVVINTNGTIKSASETAEKNFGFRPGEDIGNLGLDWADKLFEQCLIEHKQQTHDGYIQHFIDGSEYFFQPTIIPIPLGRADKKMTSAALILKDVTQVNEQMELKKSVAATVSHQLKTPLTSVRMAVHLLLEERVGSLNEKQTELLLEARDGSDRLSSIIDSLIAIDAAEGKKNTAAVYSAGLLMADAKDAYEADAMDRGLRLICKESHDLPEVLADREAIAHVFSNLINNAFRFTTAGGEITIDAVHDGDYVCFSVTDTGKGIAQEHIEHIFDRFYRVPGQEGSSGTGLGLAIVREIVQSHGGQVSVVSREGSGSQFRFTIPVYKEESK